MKNYFLYKQQSYNLVFLFDQTDVEDEKGSRGNSRSSSPYTLTSVDAAKSGMKILPNMPEMRNVKKTTWRQKRK